MAGLISGRLIDAPASWAAAVTGFMLAYLVFYGIEAGPAGPMEVLLYVPVMLLIFVAGGHLLGVGAGEIAIRTIRRAPA
jgi:hypothetical protein